MKVTIDDIEAKKTPNGGWTKETLAEWGVPWPPVKGWKQRLLEGPCPQIGTIDPPTET